jgi:cell division protein FtsL
MNAAVKVLSPGSTLGRSSAVSWKLPELKVLVLVFFVLVSALGLVYIKDLNRRLFISLQQMQTQAEQLQADNNKLLLEQSAWATQARVQQVAKQQLDMQIPSSTDVIMIKV